MARQSAGVLVAEESSREHGGMAKTLGYFEGRLNLGSERSGTLCPEAWRYHWAGRWLTYLAGEQAGSSIGPARPTKSDGGSASSLWTPPH